MKLITKPDSGSRRIAAVGMYDGVHRGHRFLIDYLGVEARSHGLKPAVVTFSRHPLQLVRPLESPALLSSLEERVTSLGEAGAEDVIVLSFNDSLRTMSAREFLKMLRSKFGIEALVLGFNNRFGHDKLTGLDQYIKVGRDVGVEIIAAPEYRGEGAPISSSAIRRHLTDGSPREAAVKLGHPYAIRGTVQGGKQFGRTIGFPTANIKPSEPSILIPRQGAYAAFVTTPDGVRRPAMVNIGYRPSVTDTSAEAPHELTIEAHIFDYEGYIYDEEILLEFIDYLRPEHRFNTPDKLRSQLKKDAEKARKILS